MGQQRQTYQLRMITVIINGQVAAVDLIAIFNQCYYPLKCAYDVQNFPGIGNYVNLLEIKDALALGMNKIDFLEMNYGWKDKWFTSVPLFKYQR
ncbi:MAG: GNAT family N-acetyltransferase [Candidatus Pacebacteria bacterium]|nr:GNAT family N-acetyltransferase [Candidatus Paceibacterota bacterium]